MTVVPYLKYTKQKISIKIYTQNKNKTKFLTLIAVHYIFSPDLEFSIHITNPLLIKGDFSCNKFLFGGRCELAWQSKNFK